MINRSQPQTYRVTAWVSANPALNNRSLLQGGCEGGDSVADTPATGYPSYDCPDTIPLDSCPHKPGYDPVHNYMGCKYLHSSSTELH